MMVFNSIKSLTAASLLLISFLSFAQEDFQGKAIYQSKTTIDMSNFGGGQMSEDRKKQIAKRMKNMFEKTYILTFNKTESVYNEEEKLEAPGGGNSRWGSMMGSFTAGPQYKNIKDQLLLQDQDFFGKQFLIKDSLPQLKWEMGGETKQIGQYLCFKATAIKKVDELDFTNFRRRSPQGENKEQDTSKVRKVNEDIEIPKDVEIVAWYTMEIPLSQGPGEFWGLPGLILEINNGRTTILCSKIIMNPEDKSVIKAPTKGKEVTQKEYNEIVKKKTEEMRDNFRGRRGQRGEGFHRS